MGPKSMASSSSFRMPLPGSSRSRTSGKRKGRSVRSLALALLLWPALAYGETWISGSFWSYHFDRTDEKNERNLGIGVEHSITERTRIAAGIYKNSNDIDSGYLVGVHCLYRDKN